MESIKNREAGIGRRFMWKDYLDKGFYAGVSWRLFSKTTQNDTKEVFGQKNEPI